MKYKCLVLDHDDTAVKSTPDIHYPSFAEALKTLRPGKHISLGEFVSYCFNPGFSKLCTDILKFDKSEQEYQYNIWVDYTNRISPDFYPGFPELLKKYKNKGGIICVVSHSESKQIIRDYNLHCGFIPDLVYGWEYEEEKRKPNPFPVLEIMNTFNLSNKDLLVVDDLKPGLDMAKGCHADFAAVGWSNKDDEIEQYMRLNSDYYFCTVEEFKMFIFS